jgi:hypothetical protein
MNLPLELVDKILQYDGRIKYRKGEFVNVIHPINLNFYRFILNPVLKKKINIHIDLEWLTNLPNGIVEAHENDDEGHNMRFIDNKYVYTNKFYFEFEFDSLPGVGLCYDYYWGTSFFEICYYDLRDINKLKQIRTTIH